MNTRRRAVTMAICSSRTVSNVPLLLDLLHHSRQYVSRTHLAELGDAATDEEPDALTPLHRMRDLLHQERLDGVGGVVHRVRLGGHVGDHRRSRRGERYRRQE